ncbi:MAG: hypothetical protein IKJ24_05960 [Clostridia bacterium]|nr:hypothetical protein [Clostridia bacterium]
MKKMIALFWAFILIFSLCACKNGQLPSEDDLQTQSEDSRQTPNDDDPADTKYKLTVIDYWGYLIKSLDEYYKAGEEVEVTLAFLSGPSVGIELNGEYIGENADTKHDGVYPIITFTMPAKDSVLYTTQNGNIGFKSTFSRAGYGISNIYDNALNASKLNDNNPWNLPIYKFDTLSDLEKFKSDFGGESGFNYGWDEVPSLNDATKYYDEAFFERYTLMLVYVTASSGSYRFGFKDVTIDGDYFCILVEQTNNPQWCTDDMAGWFITVAVPDSMVENCTEIDAILDRYSVLDLPGANLEFWIAENVDKVDFSKHQIKYGMMGGTEYYGTGYVPTVDEHGQQVDPEHCVIYTVTSYPDYSDKEQHITGIYITDPEIRFYGIGLNSSFDDFERLITQQGFEITRSNENSRTAEKGKYSITFTKEWVRIRVDVENKYGIIF